MSFLQRSSKTKSSSLDVNVRNGSGFTSPASLQKSASLEVNGNGITLAASQPQDVLPAVGLKNDNGLTLSASTEQQKPVSLAVDLKNGNGFALSTSVEQPQSALPVASVTSGLSASTEQPQSTIPAVNLPDNNLTLTTSVEQPKVTFSAAGFGTSDGPRLSAVAEPAGSAFLGTNLGNGNVGSALSASTEYASYSFATEQRKRTISGLGNRPITPTIADTRSVIQKGEWLEAARRSTEYFKTYGSSVPLVWVLTEGNKIPDNAVPFGEDRSGCTLYIARALLEGGLHIGKASVKYGAVIGYAGRERVVTNYEVLVFASQLRWGFAPVTSDGVLSQGTVVLAQQRKYRDVEAESVNVTLAEGDLLRIIRDRSFDVRLGQTGRPGETGRTEHGGQGGPEESWEPIPGVDAESLKRLAEIKTVIVIDDSLSMQEGDLWEQAQEALGGIVDINNQYGSNGADIHFMHRDDYTPDMQSKSEVDALFNRVLPDGEDTPTGETLGKIIDHYVPLIEDEQSTHKPIVVVVITDGLPTDQAELDKVIVDVANRLDDRQVKQDMFRIQFVQIGTDPAASALLHVLDDELVNRYNIRNIIDCTPYDPAHGAFDTEYMLKILLGGLQKDLDRVDPYSNGGQSVVQSAVLNTAVPCSQYEGPSPQGLNGRVDNVGRLASPRPVY